MTPGTPLPRRRWRFAGFFGTLLLVFVVAAVIDHIVTDWLGLDRRSQRPLYRITFLGIWLVTYTVGVALARWTGLERLWVLEGAPHNLALVRATLAHGQRRSPLARWRTARYARDQLDGIERYRPGDPVVAELRGYLERFERGEPLPELDRADLSVLGQPTPMGPFWEDLVTGPGDAFTWSARIVAVSALAFIVAEVGASATVGAGTALASIVTFAALVALRRGQDPAIGARTGCLLGPVLVLAAYMLGLTVYLLRQ